MSSEYIGILALLKTHERVHNPFGESFFPDIPRSPARVNHDVVKESADPLLVCTSGETGGEGVQDGWFPVLVLSVEQGLGRQGDGLVYPRLGTT